MKPINFIYCNITYGKGQPQYEPLPAQRLKDEEGTVVTCWKGGFWDRIKFLLTGKMWVRIYTFGDPFPPMNLDTKYFIIKSGYAPKIPPTQSKRNK